MSIEFMHKDLDEWISGQRLRDMPMQLYATECAAQVSTLACSILRRTPWCAALSVGLSCHLLFLYIVNKYKRGCASAAVPTIFVPLMQRVPFLEHSSLQSLFEAGDLSSEARLLGARVVP